MLIDWFTVAAQLLNFAILIGLLKRFLYQPVLDAIATRERSIAAQLAEAAASKALAHEQQTEYRKKNQSFDNQRADLLRQATDAASAEGSRLQQQARETAEAAKTQRTKALLEETQRLHTDLALRTQEQAFNISRKVLGDLTSTTLEQQMCEVFLQRLQAAQGPAMTLLREALRAMSQADPAVLRSAFPLPQPQQDRIRAALHTTCGQPIALRFETASELVSGIELRARGHKLAWSIDEYLQVLSADLPQQPLAGD